MESGGLGLGVPDSELALDTASLRQLNTWVVVKIMVPLWVP